jgi:hypothetical protein
MDREDTKVLGTMLVVVMILFAIMLMIANAQRNRFNEVTSDLPIQHINFSEYQLCDNGECVIVRDLDEIYYIDNDDVTYVNYHSSIKLVMTPKEKLHLFEYTVTDKDNYYEYKLEIGIN